MLLTVPSFSNQRLELRGHVAFIAAALRAPRSIIAFISCVGFSLVLPHERSQLTFVPPPPQLNRGRGVGAVHVAMATRPRALPMKNMAGGEKSVCSLLQRRRGFTKVPVLAFL